MFTLKLYRRHPEHHELGGTPWITEVIEAPRVSVMKIGESTCCVRVLEDDGRWRRDDIYVGKREPDMDAITDDNHYDWALVENQQGRTTEHIRPYGHG